MTITFYMLTTGQTVTTRITVPARARDTFDVTAFLRGANGASGFQLAASHGEALQAPNTQAFIVERSVFGANYGTLQASDGLTR